MKLPIGKMSREEIDDVFLKSIKYHLDAFYAVISEYEPAHLYSHWRTIIRSIDEIINIPMELPDATEKCLFLGLDFNFLNSDNLQNLKVVLGILGKRFDKNVATRFQQLSQMCMAIDLCYQKQGVFDQQGSGLRLNTTQNAIAYLQSRRAYYVTTLGLIPKIARGKKVINYIDTLNFLQYPIDGCLVSITTAYYNLLLNSCLVDFEMYSDGVVAKRNFDYDNLEGYFMEPERLSLLDQMELRQDIVVSKRMLSKSSNRLFSFSEIANVMTLFESAFDKYKIQNSEVYRELSSLMCELAVFLKEDFHIVMDECVFDAIASKYRALTLYSTSDDYFENLNGYHPFQKVDGLCYTTVVLLTRFVYRMLYRPLLKNRSFQINSGFVFEDKVSKHLEAKGYRPTGITRINHKEFDLITIKGGKVYNFQCKNNCIDISRVGCDYKVIGKLNQRLCRYYENAIIKEEKREDLIKSETGISDIEHFVVSRFPVITRNPRILNFIDLDRWNL